MCRFHWRDQRFGASIRPLREANCKKNRHEESADRRGDASSLQEDKHRRIASDLPFALHRSQRAVQRFVGQAKIDRKILDRHVQRKAMCGATAFGEQQVTHPRAGAFQAQSLDTGTRLTKLPRDDGQPLHCELGIRVQQRAQLVGVQLAVSTRAAADRASPRASRAPRSTRSAPTPPHARRARLARRLLGVAHPARPSRTDRAHALSAPDGPGARSRSMRSRARGG